MPIEMVIALPCFSYVLIRSRVVFGTLEAQAAILAQRMMPAPTHHYTGAGSAAAGYREALRYTPALVSSMDASHLGTRPRHAPRGPASPSRAKRARDAPFPGDVTHHARLLKVQRVSESKDGPDTA